MTDGRGFPPEAALRLFGEPRGHVPGERISAGAISCTFEGMALRWIKCGEVEVLRGIAFVVRDRDWGTYQPEVRLEAFADRPDGILLRLGARISEQEAALDCQIEVQLNEAGLSVSAHASAGGDFHTNRTGLVVLHPASAAGAAVRVSHGNGGVTTGRFPEKVSPHQPFFDIAAIEHDAAPGLAVGITFTGDVFEMEDQRNWSDASFKTYSRPLALPYPYVIADGESVAQRVSVTISSASKPKLPAWRKLPRIEPTAEAAGLMPRLGIGGRLPDYRASGAERELLGKLRPSLLMLEAESLDALASESYREALQATGAKPAIMLRPTREVLAGLCEHLARAGLASPELALVTSDPAVIEEARRLIPGARVGAGTDAFFAEFNRTPPPDADFLFWTVCPTVHAMDDASVMETLSVLGDQAATARARHPGAALWCGPVTFRMRFNPNATAPGAAEAAAGADARQRGLFAAAFALGQIAAWAAARLDTLVLYAPFGPRGFVPVQNESPEARHGTPAEGSIAAGAVYPAYHVLAGLAGQSGKPLARLQNEVPERVIALATADALWLANRGREDVAVSVPGTSARLLDSESFIAATGDPDGFWSRDPVPLAGGRLKLPAYAVARVALR